MFLTFIIVSWCVSQIIGVSLVRQRAEDTGKTVETIAQEISPYLATWDAEGMQEVLTARGQEYSGRLLVLDLNGVVQSDSFSLLTGYKLDHREVESVLYGGSAGAYGFHRVSEKANAAASGSAEGGEQIWALYYTYVIVSNSRTIGAVLFSTSLQSVVQQMTELQLNILYVFLAVALFSVILGYLLSRYITKPIKTLTSAAIDISSGHFDRRIEVKGHSEISQLSQTFNMMCDKLENLEEHRNEFISNASHELKTPLSSIKILTESLLYQPPDEKMYKEFLTDINSEIDRLNAVISDLLLLVHIDEQEDEKPKLSPVPLQQILGRAVRGLMPVAQSRKIELEYTVENSVTVFCDELKLQQALYNVVDNAIKYTHDEGHVKVTLSDDGDNAVVRVEDNGVGIPKDAIPHIFDRFYRVDKARSRSTGGTGLGLSIVDKIIKMHGGRIEVESEEGAGSIFTIYLPKRLQ